LILIGNPRFVLLTVVALDLRTRIAKQKERSPLDCHVSSRHCLLIFPFLGHPIIRSPYKSNVA
jgi:hypothetical protein